MSAEQASSGPVRAPQSFRAMWGTTSPTNPRSPAKLTTAAAEALAQTRQSIRTPFTRTPRERAMLSPRQSSWILPEKASDIKSTARMIPPGSQSRRMSVLDSPPTEKALYETRTSVSSREKKDMPALKSACTAMPDRITVDWDASTRLATAMIRSVAPNAPANAASGSPAAAAGKQLSTRMTTNPAPALTPMMLGEARSLPVTLCKSTPETDSPVPARTPCSSRGSRSA